MRYYLLLSTAVLLLNNNLAIASSNKLLSTHAHLELKSTPSNDNSASFKVAAVCGLGTGDCANKFSYNESSDDTNTHQCRPGYTYVNKQGCVRDVCPTNMKFEPCSGTNYIQTGTALSPSGRSCYGCRAEECSAYTLSSCPTNGNCSNCPDNSTQKKLNSCTSNYKISANTCILKTCPSDFACLGSEICVSGTCKNDACPSGYQKSSSCDNGISGTINTAAGTPCYQCKDCPNNCNLNSCPSGATCDYETCSGKFCATGCEVGKLNLDNFWCGGALRCWIN